MTVGPAGEYGSSAAHSADDTADNIDDTVNDNDAQIDKDRVRASDGERAAFAETVMTAGRDGRLDIDETDHRLAQVYAAKFREDLHELIMDLPRED